MTAQTQRVVRIKQVAELLGVSVATVNRMRRQGRLLQPFKISAQAVGWDLKDLQIWIENQKAACH